MTGEAENKKRGYGESDEDVEAHDPTGDVDGTPQRAEVEDPPPESSKPESQIESPAASVSQETPQRAFQVTEDLFEPEGDEPFERLGTAKLGVVGGKGVGKSYFFQAMVWRAMTSHSLGPLNPFLDREAIWLWSTLDPKQRKRLVNLRTFVRNYERWYRLPPTLSMDQAWYRLRLGYRRGILGRESSALDVEFFDGSGEFFFEAAHTESSRPIWCENFLEAKVMVFCFPLWAAFPIPNLSPEDSALRENFLSGFQSVVNNYRRLMDENGRTPRGLSILALTMADDRRLALEGLRERWILPLIKQGNSDRFRTRATSGSGLQRYLEMAREVSNRLHDSFARHPLPYVSEIPDKVKFGNRKTWLIPLSAIDGSVLDTLDSDKGYQPSEGGNLPIPVPAHVELPLLVTLAEQTHALM